MFIQYALDVGELEAREHRLEGVDGAIVGIDAYKQLTLWACFGRPGPSGLCSNGAEARFDAHGKEQEWRRVAQQADIPLRRAELREAAVARTDSRPAADCKF